MTCIGTNTTPITQVLLCFFFFVALSFLLRFCSCDVPVFLFRFCPNPTFQTSNYTTYQSNFYTLLSTLSSDATSNSNNIYSNATVGQSSNAVYGLYYCRGDDTHDVCSDCVLTAAQDMSQLCPSEEYGYVWYDQCMFRYSNQPFFSILSQAPLYYMSNTKDISVDPTQFNILVSDTMTKAAIEATSDSMRFATREAYFTQNQTLYCLVQCSLDLSENDCGTCLSDAIADLPSCCSDKQGGRVVNPSCNVRYEIYSFYNVTASAPSPSPVLAPSPLPSNSTTSPPSPLPSNSTTSPPSPSLLAPLPLPSNSTTSPSPSLLAPLPLPSNSTTPSPSLLAPSPSLLAPLPLPSNSTTSPSPSLLAPLPLPSNSTTSPSPSLLAPPHQSNTDNTTTPGELLELKIRS